jgi:hypothetical protein
MRFDPDAFEERAAIVEFDGGLSRFQAETMAAKAQGLTRWQALTEAANANRNGNPARGGDKPAQARRDAAHHLPGVQPASQEQDRPVSERDVQAGRDRLALLALQHERGGIL